MNYYDFSIDVVVKAGKLVKESLEGNLQVSHKGIDSKDIVTDIDISVNTFLTEEIKKQFPDHAIYSEEAENDGIHSEYVWAIDPIDGSANFSRRIPHFATCLALLKSGEPIVGVVYNPITDELFSFEKGNGVFLNGKPITVNTFTTLKDAQASLIIGHKAPLWDWGMATFRSFIEHLSKTKAFGSSALDICFVAAGRLDVVVYGTMTTKDVSGAIGILRAAGGEIYNVRDGTVAELSDKKQTVVVTANKILFDAVRPHLHTDLLPPIISS